MKRFCLIVMDGWGINPRPDGNAVAAARLPNLARLGAAHPSTALECSGLAVGLPAGQMGNSEVGHLTLGAGRVIYQELTRVSKAAEDGSLAESPELKRFIEAVRARGGAAHLLGLVSDGGVHSHVAHLDALLAALNRGGLKRVFVHAFLDGRDTPPSSAADFVGELEAGLERSGHGRIATVIGRFWAMDRDKRWERVKRAYDCMVHGKGARFTGGALEAVKEAYACGETDEFVQPSVVMTDGLPTASVKDGDGVLFFNFRADRARELTAAFTSDAFDGFDRQGRPALSAFLTMTEYDRTLGVPAIFKPQEISANLGETVSRLGLRQFRVSETEKYAHVTFFFNGGVEAPLPGEERLLIPSVKDVPTYDLKPEMRAKEIAEAAVERIRDGDYHFMLMNFANGDMVGHTGVFDAAVRGCEAVDSAVGMVADAALSKGWVVAVTADHGNAEQMVDYSTGEPHTAHTTNKVPFILAGAGLSGGVTLRGGGLEDVAPTVLKCMGAAQPREMSGSPLY